MKRKKSHTRILSPPFSLHPLHSSSLCRESCRSGSGSQASLSAFPSNLPFPFLSLLLLLYPSSPPLFFPSPSLCSQFASISQSVARLISFREQLLPAPSSSFSSAAKGEEVLLTAKNFSRSLLFASLLSQVSPSSPSRDTHQLFPHVFCFFPGNKFLFKKKKREERYTSCYPPNSSSIFLLINSLVCAPSVDRISNIFKIHVTTSTLLTLSSSSSKEKEDSISASNNCPK